MFDNDGTLWCEKPQYLQLLFMLDELQRRSRCRPVDRSSARSSGR